MTNAEKLKVARRMITVMLCILLGCYTAFLLAPNLFKIILPDNLILVDNFVSNNKGVMLAISTITMYAHLLLFYLAVFQKWKFDKWWLWLGLACIVILINSLTIFIEWSNYIWSIYSLAQDVLLLVAIPILIGHFLFKEKLEVIFLKSVCGFLLYFGYKEVSDIIKDIHQITALWSIATNIILMIDVYTAQFILYIYTNLLKKEENRMSGNMKPIAGEEKLSIEKQIKIAKKKRMNARIKADKANAEVGKQDAIVKALREKLVDIEAENKGE